MFKRICKLFLVLLLAVPLAACDSGNPGPHTHQQPNGTVTACTTYPTVPYLALSNHGTPVIQTFTESYCDQPPQELHTQVTMERHNADGTWTQVTGVNGSFTDCAEIPDPLGIKCYFELEPCEDGFYRTVVSVLGVATDGEPIGTTGPHGEPQALTLGQKPTTQEELKCP